MSPNMSIPRVIRTHQNTQLSYELPHRIYTTKAYPIRSPNGSTIILYGHENGVRVIWRGGRPFKTSRLAPVPAQKTNGSGAVISLDSDDEGGSAPFEEKSEFEDDEDDLDPSQPYPPILQTLDICFHTDVLHLATLTSSILQAEGPSWRGLESLKRELVFVAACGDNTVRLVTLPLTPPSPASKTRTEFQTDITSADAGKGKWGETITILNGHQKPSNCISITANPGDGPRALVKTDANSSALDPQVIIASHSPEVTGILRFYRVPIGFKQKSVDPFQTVYMSSLAKAISFNPATSRGYASILLVAHSAGTCRMYDYSLLATEASEEPNEAPKTEYGTWLVSFYTGFHDTKGDAPNARVHPSYGRKLITDAQWVSGGKGIIVLMEDGEWAIWDVEGSGPNTSQGLLGRQGVTGGSISGYSLSGHLDISNKSRPAAPTPMTLSRFAPMTPGTRRTVEPFGTRGSNVPARGQISVMELPRVSPTSPPEESILFWFGDTYAAIPSLSKYWSAHKSGGTGTLFSGPSGARMIKFENIDLQGERCSGIEQISRENPSTGLDIIVLAEHRFTILTTSKPPKPATAIASNKQERRLVLAQKSANGGELDVSGIEEALARMENNSSRRKIF